MWRWVRSRRSRLIWVDLLLASKLDQVRGWRSPWGVTERKIEEELLQSIPVDVEDGRNEWMMDELKREGKGEGGRKKINRYSSPCEIDVQS